MIEIRQIVDVMKDWFTEQKGNLIYECGEIVQY